MTFRNFLTLYFQRIPHFLPRCKGNAYKVKLAHEQNKVPILMDLSFKVFDSIKHDLLLAKLDPDGFSRKSLRLTESFLENRHQRVKINNGSFTTYKQLSLSVPKGSVPGLLFINIYINDSLLSIKDAIIILIM